MFCIGFRVVASRGSASSFQRSESFGAIARSKFPRVEELSAFENPSHDRHALIPLRRRILSCSCDHAGASSSVRPLREDYGYFRMNSELCY